MRAAKPDLDAMDGVFGHGLGGDAEQRRLVHVVPESGDAGVDEGLVQRPPPLARRLAREIWEDGVAWPHLADQNVAVRLLDEVVAGHAAVIGLVVLARRAGDVQIGDGDQLDA